MRRHTSSHGSWRLGRSLVFAVVGVLSTSCAGLAGGSSDGGNNEAKVDAGNTHDAGTGHADAGHSDDAGVPHDAGHVDDAGAPRDAGVADAGSTTPTASPDEPGPFATSSTTSSLAIPGGLNGRTMGLTIVTPVGAPAAPVVVIHPGFLLDAALYTSYAENLASHGFVAILVAPPYALVGGPNHAELAVGLSRVLDWVTTESSAGHSLAGIADATRIGLAGHSLGGKISLLLATTDARPLAVFGIDPVDAAGGFGGPSTNFPSVTPELMGEIHVPIVVVGETTNSTCSGAFCQSCAPAADNFAQYFDHATSPALELTVANANHMSFLDNPQCGLTCSACTAGSDDTAVTRRITRRAMTAFFQKVLLHNDAADVFLTGSALQVDIDAGLVTRASKNGF